MRKVELLPTRDCEAGYGPAAHVVILWLLQAGVAVKVPGGGTQVWVW